MNKKFKWVMGSLPLLFLLSMFSINSHAAIFSITPKSPLPTLVNGCSSIKAYYTVTNTTGKPLTVNFVKYLPLNVTQVTVDGAVPDLCGATFSLSSPAHPSNSCTLELNITGAVNAFDPDPHHHLFVCTSGCSICSTCCTGTKFPLNVTVVPPTEIVVNNGVINFAISHTFQFTAIAHYPDGSIVNITSSPTTTWRSANEAIATINTYPQSPPGLATGRSAGIVQINAICGSVTNTTGGHLQVITSFRKGFSGNYITNTPTPLYPLGSISMCPTEPNGTLKTCVITAPNELNQPIDMVINKTGTLAYILNAGNSTMAICKVTNNGVLKNCTTKIDPAFSLSRGNVSINSKESLLYVSNFDNNTLSTCGINTDGSLSNCALSFDPSFASSSRNVG